VARQAMRAPRFALILTFVAIPILGFGCIGVATDGSWPPGTEAIVSTGAAQVLANVPIGQRNQVVGRRWVTIAKGTRVVCIDPLRYVSSKSPYSADRSIFAIPVRVKPLTGAYNGIELVVQNGELSLPPEPIPAGVRAAVLVPVVCVCVSAALALLETCADALMRRRRLVRQWSAAHPGERFADRLRSHRISPAPLHRREPDDARWLEWIASRNARRNS
jgi:hypothetical protein